MINLNENKHLCSVSPMSDDTDGSLRVNRTQMPHELDRGVGWRARIGLVVLSSDYTIEHEFARMLSLPGVVVYHNRIENDARSARHLWPICARAWHHQFV